MDAVILFVDMDDPKWLSEYEKHIAFPVDTKRFRDWGFLKYVMRGIDTYMPFIDRIHLVVMMDSQVPEWVNREKVNIVYHEDIIPKEFLPLFNSSSIEMFIHKIPGLSEEFIYFNDDFFPTQPLEYSDFFDGNGKIYNSFQDDVSVKPGYYLENLKRCTRIAALNFAIVEEPSKLNFPQHIMAPFIKKEMELCYNHTKEIIDNSVSKMRLPYNLTQYLYTNDLYYKGLMIDKPIPNKVLYTTIHSPDVIEKYFFDEGVKAICINDWGENFYLDFLTYKEKTLNILKDKYSKPSRYEL
jgi:hypothetical protein